MPSFLLRPPRRPPRHRLIFTRSGAPLTIQVTEPLTVGETVAVSVPFIGLAVTDAVTVNDSVSIGVSVSLQVQETVTVGETLTFFLPTLSIALTEPVVLTDTVSLLHNATRVVTVSDSLTLGETTTFLIPLLRLTTTETVTLGETLTLTAALASIQVTDAITVGDMVGLSTIFLAVHVQDDLTVGELLTFNLINFLRPVDGLLLTDTTVARRAVLAVAITEALTLTETVTEAFPGLRFVQATDALTLTETLTIRGLRLVTTVTDGLTVGESVTGQQQRLFLQVTDGVSVGTTITFLVSAPVIVVPNAPLPIEQRHWADQFFLSLQRRETAYNVLITRWDATTATLMNQVDDDTVHEQWDDQVHGQELIRLGYQAANAQVLAQQSLRIAFTEPRVCPHTLAGLLGLTLGQISSIAQPAQANSYRHTITLAAPTLLPSISAQIGHQQNRYFGYGGIKSDGFTLENNGPYVKFACPLIGSGSRVDLTGTTRAGLTFHPSSGAPPTSQRITDGQGGLWYLYPDGQGGLTVDTSPPAGVSLNVGTGLTLGALDGTAARLGMSSTGSIEVTPVTPPVGPALIDVCILADSTGTLWYIWIEDLLVTIDTVFPATLPTLAANQSPEAWLRWGNSRLWLADALGAPPATPTQGITTLGGSAVEMSNRVLQVSVQGDNQLLASEAYRVSTGRVRGNFHAMQRQLRVSLTLEVTSATEASDLAAYLTQRALAFEWQCLGPVPAIGVWQPGFVVILPRLQYRALVRQQQQQNDVLQLTGTVLEDAQHQPVVATVYNEHASYLQPA